MEKPEWISALEEKNKYISWWMCTFHRMQFINDLVYMFEPDMHKQKVPPMDF